MLTPRAQAWTLSQRWLIVTSAAVALSALALGIYAYERHRGPTDSVFFGTWEMEGMCMDCTFYLRLQSDHGVVGFGEADPDFRWPVGRGRWYAGGKLLVIHFAAEQADAVRPLVMRIMDIAPDVIRLRHDGEEVRMVRSSYEPPQASNQAMQRTAGRSAFKFSMISTFNLQPLAPSPAVADLVSR